MKTLSRVEFCVAGQGDEAELRRILRETPMPGAIRLTFEREPDYFADSRLSDTRVILAKENVRGVCMGRCSVSRRFVNGVPARVGYLSELRLVGSHHGRFDILRRGYHFAREIFDPDPPEFWFTSIAADNVRSLRFLERGVPKMPRYHPLGDIQTSLIPALEKSDDHSPLQVVAATEENFPAMAEWLNHAACQRQLGVFWSVEKFQMLQLLGLRAEDWFLFYKGGKLTGCSAIWDQRTYRQTRVAGYDWRLRLGRPWINGLAVVTGHPHFPTTGEMLPAAYVIGLAADTVNVVPFLQTAAWQRGISLLIASRSALRGYHYRTSLFAVQWPGDSAVAPTPDRPLAPEVAFL